MSAPSIEQIQELLYQSFTSTTRECEAILTSLCPLESYRVNILNIVHNPETPLPIRKASIIQLKKIAESSEDGFHFVLNSFESLNQIQNGEIQRCMEIISESLALHGSFEILFQYISHLLTNMSYINLKIVFLLIASISVIHEDKREFLCQQFLGLLINNIQQVIIYIQKRSENEPPASDVYFIHLYIYYLFICCNKIFPEIPFEILNAIFEILYYFLLNDPNTPGFDLVFRIARILYYCIPNGYDKNIDFHRLVQTMNVYKNSPHFTTKAFQYLLEILGFAMKEKNFSQDNQLLPCLPLILKGFIFVWFNISQNFDPKNLDLQMFLDSYHPDLTSPTIVASAERFINSMNFGEKTFLIYVCALELAQADLQNPNSLTVYSVFNFLAQFLRNLKSVEGLSIFHGFIQNYIVPIIQNPPDIVSLAGALNFISFLNEGYLFQFSNELNLLPKLCEWIKTLQCELITYFSIIILGTLSPTLSPPDFQVLIPLAFEYNNKFKTDTLPRTLNLIITNSGDSIKQYVFESLKQVLLLFNDFFEENDPDNSSLYAYGSDFLACVPNFLELAENKMPLIELIFQWLLDIIQNKPKIIEYFSDEFLQILLDTSEYSDENYFQIIFSISFQILDHVESGMAAIGPALKIIINYIIIIKPLFPNLITIINKMLQILIKKEYDEIDPNFLVTIFFKYKNENECIEFANNLLQLLNKELNDMVCDVEDVYAAIVICCPQFNRNGQMNMLIHKSYSLLAMCAIANCLEAFGNELNENEKSLMLNEFKEQYNVYMEVLRDDNVEPLYRNEMFQSELNRSIDIMKTLFK